MISQFKHGYFALILTVGIGLCNPAAVAGEGYYRWIDERGNPQLSDRPPPAGVKYEYVSTSTGLKRRTDPVAGGGNPNPSADAADPTAVPPTVTAQTKIKKNPAYCDQAKANLDTLNSAARVRIRDAEGNIRYLTDEEKDIQRRKANDMISVHCNN